MDLLVSLLCVVNIHLIGVVSQTNISWDELEHNLTKYNYDLPPWTKAGTRTRVSTQLIIAHLKSSTISEIDLTFHLVQQWTDLRLQYDPGSIAFSGKYVLIDLDKYIMIWVPDSYISNAISEVEHSVTKPNVFIRAYPNGTLTKSSRITAQIPCPVTASGFPHGKQICDIRLKSYSFTNTEIDMTWSNIPYLFIHEFYDNGLQVKNLEPSICTEKFNGEEQPCLQLRMTVIRNYNSYILRIYVPSGLLVVLGWLSMWIDKGQVGARTSLGVICVLSLVTQIVAVITMAQGLEGVIAIDVWMCACMIFTIVSLSVFAVVHNVKRRAEKVKGRRKNLHQSDAEKGSKPEKPKYMLSHGRIQNIFRVVYPVAFLTFNLAYWAYFLRSS